MCLFLAGLDLHCCAWAFSSCGEGGREGSFHLTIFQIPKEHDDTEREESRNQNAKMAAASLSWCRMSSND